MELGCALMENLIKPFDEELFHKANQNLQCPICLPHYDPLQISFLKGDGGISKRKTN